MLELPEAWGSDPLGYVAATARLALVVNRFWIESEGIASLLARNMPKKQGVYVATIGADVLYVGCAQNMYKRWHHQIHQRRTDLKELGCDTLLYFSLFGRRFRDAEKIVADKLKPRLNGTVTIDAKEQAKWRLERPISELAIKAAMIELDAFGESLALIMSAHK